MKTITLSKGKIALVDDADFEALNRYKWSYTKNCKSEYAKACIGGRKHKTTLYMHRVILGVNDPLVIVDHIDGNGLNNTRINIRKCTKSENQRNKKKRSNSSSQYLGVTKTNWGWVAQITHNTKPIRIGLFKDEAEAALAYNKKKIELHGEFAKLNTV